MPLNRSISYNTYFDEFELSLLLIQSITLFFVSLFISFNFSFFYIYQNLFI